MLLDVKRLAETAGSVASIGPSNWSSGMAAEAAELEGDSPLARQLALAPVVAAAAGGGHTVAMGVGTL